MVKNEWTLECLCILTIQNIALASFSQRSSFSPFEFMYWILSFLLFSGCFCNRVSRLSNAKQRRWWTADTIRDHGSEPEAFSEQVLLSRQTVGVPGGIPPVLFGKNTGVGGVGGRGPCHWREMLATFYNTEELEIPIFLKVIRCNFDPSRTLEKIPAGRSKAFFRWAGIKTRVNFHDYIWTTTNHCKDPY